MIHTTQTWNIRDMVNTFQRRPAKVVKIFDNGDLLVQEGGIHAVSYRLTSDLVTKIEKPSYII